VSAQLDMFCSEKPSFPPFLDPARAFDVKVFLAVDRDHVGVEAIGRLGNNRLVSVVKVYDEQGTVLRAECFEDAEQAEARRESILVQLKRNQQGFLNL
jgi:hypothetical protein